MPPHSASDCARREIMGTLSADARAKHAVCKAALTAQTAEAAEEMRSVEARLPRDALADIIMAAGPQLHELNRELNELVATGSLRSCRGLAPTGRTFQRGPSSTPPSPTLDMSCRVLRA